jgi:hypothetical protein
VKIDFLPFGLTACRPGLQAIIDYALQRSLIARKIDVEELFDDTTRARGLSGEPSRRCQNTF